MGLQLNYHQVSKTFVWITLLSAIKCDKWGSRFSVMFKFWMVCICCYFSMSYRRYILQGIWLMLLTSLSLNCIECIDGYFGIFMNCKGCFLFWWLRSSFSVVVRTNDQRTFYILNPSLHNIIFNKGCLYTVYGSFLRDHKYILHAQSWTK